MKAARQWRVSARLGLGCLVVSAVFFSSCRDKSEGLRGTAAEGYLTDAIFIPNEGPTLDNPSTDDSVSVSPPSSGGTATTMGGGMVMVQIPFSAPQGNVIGGGIRFGATGPIRTVSVGAAAGQTSGTVAFPVQIPAGICDDLSRICHDIKCYEFAVTDAGQVSQANITDLAVLCGGCDEPSCQSLVDCPSTPSSTGGTVSPGLGVICSDSGAGGCGSGSIEYCIDSDRNQCWYDANGRRFDCSCSSTNSTCVQDVVDYCVSL